jgi:hypothetical protein
MSDNKKKHIDVTTAWAYRLKNGTFYKQGCRGSFSTGNKPYSMKEITTKHLPSATFFKEPLSGSPYCAPSLMGGKWINVTTTSIYEWE